MPELRERLERALNPRVVAIVGDKGPNYQWLNNYKGFTGKLYSVQVDPREIPGIEALGIENYPSLTAIPAEIDYVQCAVPRTIAPRIAADAAAKRVGAIAFFTSGFAETDEEQGISLQAEILRIAHENDMLVVGPNCMGLYNPLAGIRHSPDQPVGKAGPVGFVSQSGTHATNFGAVGGVNGVFVSKSISMGNAIVLDSAHYLDYLTHDPATEVIGMYVEGIRDGRRFFETLKAACAVKPVVLWKGGLTEAGQRATHSHTASLATPASIWDAVVRQCGALRADTLEDMLDVCKALVHAKPTTGRRMALMAMTGGPSVGITDAFVSAGLEVPAMTDASYAELAEFFNVIGGSYRNPFDMAGTIRMTPQGEEDNFHRLLRIADADPNVDAIAVEARGVAPMSGDATQRMIETILEQQAHSTKPVVAIINPGSREGAAAETRQLFLENGIAAFHSFDRAAQALARAIRYWRFRAGLD